MTELRPDGGLALVLLSSLLLSIGCATSTGHREVPNFDHRFTSLETVTLLPPRAAVYRRTVGGVDEEVEAWSDEARRELTAAVRERAERLGHFRFIPFVEPPAPEEPSDEPEVRSTRDETWDLFQAVIRAIQVHTYSGPNQFPERRTQFDYTLGEEAGEIVAATGADAVLLVVAFDHVETSGRQAARAAGMVVGAITGVVVTPPPSPAVVTIALIEAKTGDILWYNQVGSTSADIRDRASDTRLVNLALKGIDDG